MKAWHPIAIAAALMVGGCASEPVALDEAKAPGTCPCTETKGGDPCPQTHCGLRILVDSATCKDKLTRVEIMIGDTLEPEPWKLGAARMACRGLAGGDKAVVYARADTPWMWQSEPLECVASQAGKAIDHVLECKTGG